jgi:hypothetical protein
MDRANVAGPEWNRIDLDRRCCYIPSYQSKGGDPIPVPLNDDDHGAGALAERSAHERDKELSAAVHRYVFVSRRRAPIQKMRS